ncbi:replication-relaxation family protein [Dactylosporangium sp. CA-092794]|uniref:replication-relaxation family protein n=1 Tax=Dactylosporangium sp. CA-092794 TaxID=3239929 RepID=UPI003D9415C0
MRRRYGAGPRRLFPIPADDVDPSEAVLGRLGLQHWAVLGVLAEHGELTVDQITRLLFGSRSTAVRHLGVLVEAGLVRRYESVRGRSHLAHYHAGAAGLRALRRRLRQEGRPVPPKLGSETFGRPVVTEFFARLAAAPDGHLYRWRRHVDTALWLASHDIHGVRPQAYSIWIEHDVAVRFVLHIDDDSVTPLTHRAPPPPTRELAGYRTAPRGVPVAAILMITPTGLRERELHQGLATAPLPVTVASTTLRRCSRAASPADAIWNVAGAERGTLVRLAEIPHADQSNAATP